MPHRTEPFTVDRYDRHDGGGAADVPLIDLDLVRPRDSERPRQGRFARRPVLATFAAAAVLAVAASGGSADATTGRLDKVLTLNTVQDGHLAIAAGGVFVAARNAEHNTEIRRRSLDGRGAEWSIALAASVENLTVRPTAQVVLASVAGEGTTAVDMPTGRLLWRNPTGHHVMSSNDVALLEKSPTNEGGPRSVEAVDLRTGRTVWSHKAAEATQWLLDQPATPTESPQFVVVVEPGADVTTFRFADGAVLAHRALRLPVSQWGEEVEDDFTEVSADGDTLFHARQQGDRTTLAAYRISTLEPIWRQEDGPVGPVSACGPVICVHGADAVSGLDPRTGTPRWTAPGWGYASPLDHRLIAFAGEGSITAGLLDPETGRVMHQLGAGMVMEGSNRFFLRQDVASPGGTWVVDMAPDRPAMRVLGRLDEPTTMPCAADGPYVACMSAVGTVTVWRVRPGP